ncbi:proline-rich protein 32 [Sturnira hondurensis]|uniref:proline-rich protein 32 n=1 Tax=Sturnira hondurensis TaxID=192404 RepID=UPI00187AF757|nr:proline-rich protein 32 [Sturnira hondurensis]
MATLKPITAPYRGDGDLCCPAGLRKDKDVGNFWAWLWLIAFWGAREVLGTMGNQSSEQKCTQPPPVLDVGIFLEGHSSSPVAVTADENKNETPQPSVSLQLSSTMLMDKVGSWGQPRLPLRLPFSLPPELAREQLESLWEKRGSNIPVDSSRALKHPEGPPPAVVKESLATAEVNSSEGLAVWKQMGQDSINISPKFSSSSPSLMVGGAGVSNENMERGVNNANVHVALPQGQGFFPLRCPQVRGPPGIPTIRSGIMTEAPPGYLRMPNNERMAHVSFPTGSPWLSMENWQRPVIIPPGIAPLPSWPSAPGFICPLFWSFNPFLNMPMRFAPAPINGSPPLPTFAHFPPRNMIPPASFIRENK